MRYLDFRVLRLGILVGFVMIMAPACGGGFSAVSRLEGRIETLEAHIEELVGLEEQIEVAQARIEELERRTAPIGLSGDTLLLNANVHIAGKTLVLEQPGLPGSLVLGRSHMLGDVGFGPDITILGEGGVELFRVGSELNTLGGYMYLRRPNDTFVARIQEGGLTVFDPAGITYTIYDAWTQ